MKTTETLKPQFEARVTKDYSIFKMPAYQRPFTHRKRTFESVKTQGLIEPIVVDKFGNIVNGQHRFNYLKSLKRPIEYVINHALDNKEKSARAFREANENMNKPNAYEAFCSEAGKGNWHAQQGVRIANEWNREVKKLSKQSALEMLRKRTSGASLKRSAYENTYEIDTSQGFNVFTFARAIQESGWIKNPFTSRMVRAIIKAYRELGLLDQSVIPAMAKISPEFIVDANDANNATRLINLYNKAKRKS